MLDIMRDMVKDIDRALKKAYEAAEMFINYVSTFTFTPTDWIDFQEFSNHLYIATDSEGILKIYDNEFDTYYPIYKLGVHPTLYFVYRFIELIEAGILKIQK